MVAISVDPPETSEHLRQLAGYSFLFLCDDKARVIREWDLVHAHAGVNGADIARPAEFLLDSKGWVRWVDLTDDYLVRARPERVLEAIDSANLAAN